MSLGPIFHLAIPCRPLAEAEQFYVGKLGAEARRRYEDRVTLAFFNHQLVCHLAPNQVPAEPTLYPRHFGITFPQLDEFEAVLTHLSQSGTKLLRAPFERFPGQPEAHRSFFLNDPSNNVIEFKHYADPRYMF